jgi:hypothetical protein
MLQERVRGAAGASKHRKFPGLSSSIQPYRSLSTHDCGGVFSYAKVTAVARDGYARAMQYEFLFIFQKGIRTGIEYRV